MLPTLPYLKKTHENYDRAKKYQKKKLKVPEIIFDYTTCLSSRYIFL